ncbi:MAG: hypothetical protein QGH39_12640 [Candidatus Thermoplasmatota archaeon]|nr:hypothetical protein [Candidatus Thermoplasmatota archaeon]
MDAGEFQFTGATRASERSGPTILVKMSQYISSLQVKTYHTVDIAVKN